MVNNPLSDEITLINLKHVHSFAIIDMGYIGVKS